jgi:hypothetical protein
LRLNVTTSFFSLLLFSILVLSARDGTPETIDEKGQVVGATHVNIRSGPGLNHPPITVLKNGEEIIVERLETSWYRISLPDGQKGYVYEEFIRLLPGKPIEPSLPPSVPATASAAPETGSAGETDHKFEDEPKFVPPQPEPFPLPPAERETLKTPSPLPMQIVHNAQAEILKWLGAGLSIFIFGWILRGKYYMRRERIRRTKLRF